MRVIVLSLLFVFSFFFFFNDTATTEIYTLSLHDALPISWGVSQLETLGSGTRVMLSLGAGIYEELLFRVVLVTALARSEEHTSELQSQSNLVCRLLLEKKKKRKLQINTASHEPPILHRST